MLHSHMRTHSFSKRERERERERDILVHGHYSLFYFDHTNKKNTWNNKVYLSIVKMHFPWIASNVPCFFKAPGSLLHRADKDFEVGEYVIPKGATVIAITRGLMYDPKVSIE